MTGTSTKTHEGKGDRGGDTEISADTTGLIFEVLPAIYKL